LLPEEDYALGFPAIETRRNNRVFTFRMKWLLSMPECISNCEMVPQHVTCPLKNP